MIKAICNGFTPGNEVSFSKNLFKNSIKTIYNLNLMLADNVKIKMENFFNLRANEIIKVKTLNKKKKISLIKFEKSKDVEKIISDKLTAKGFIVTNENDSDYKLHYYLGDAPSKGPDKKNILIKIVSNSAEEEVYIHFRHEFKLFYNADELVSSIDSLLNQL